jgi:ribonuclease-3
MNNYEELERIIKVKFKNKDLIREALTHRSYLNENRGSGGNHNERLEFLGDAVLELVVTDYLFKNYNKAEGELTNWRAALVKGETLAIVADELGIEKFLNMSKGESKDMGRARNYRLANVTEAIIGAIYLDRGYNIADKFINENIIIKLDNIIENKTYLDAKSYFQQKAQEEMQSTPHYEVIKEWGPDHDKTFLVGVFVGDKKIAEGEGASKQDAQRQAAANGLKEKGWM